MRTHTDQVAVNRSRRAQVAAWRRDKKTSLKTRKEQRNSARGNVVSFLTVTRSRAIPTAQRLARWYPHRCQSGKCQRNAFHIQYGIDKSGRERWRVVCADHLKAKRWKE